MITIEKAREKLGPDYDKYSDERIEKLILNYSKLATTIVDLAEQEYEIEKNHIQ